MNRILSPIPASLRKAFCWSFLLAFLPAGVNAATAAARAPQTQKVRSLRSSAAAKLLIHVVKPTYPPIAKVNFIHGPVKLEIKVTPTGRVAEVHVVDGEPLLAAAAIEAVRKWLYRPYVLEEGPVPFRTDVVVMFNLHPHSLWGRMPNDADSYLEKQVHPPEVIYRPQKDQTGVGIPMKVLVDSKGEVVDAISTEAKEAEADLARKSLRSWKFQPARWGTLTVPWYIKVTVPLDRVSMDQLANTAKH